MGDKTGFYFEMPAPKSDDSKYTGFTFRDITINAPLLPKPFVFKLMGEGHEYKAPLSGNDPAIAKAAMKAERFISQTVDTPNTRNFYYLNNHQYLNEVQCKEIGKIHHWDVVKGIVNGQNGSTQKLVVKRRMTEEELKAAVDMDSIYSQHSSIVANDKVPAHSMTYDLAIGECKAFEQKGFWKRLLLRADWRREENPIADERKYYQDGILPFEHMKKFMNKPELPKGIPLGDAGVDNDYGPTEAPKIKDKRSTENTTNEILQWDMPDPQI